MLIMIWLEEEWYDPLLVIVIFILRIRKWF